MIFLKPSRCGYTLRVTSNKHIIHLSTLHQHSKYKINCLALWLDESAHACTRSELRGASCEDWKSALRLVSTQENYPWIGTDKKIFVVLKPLFPTQSSQDKEQFSCPFQSTDNFPEWKLALKHVGRQHDDDGQNKSLQINDSKENLSYITIPMNLVQYKKLKTLALCLGRVLLNRILTSCTCYGLKCRRCIKDVKICDLLYVVNRATSTFWNSPGTLIIYNYFHWLIVLVAVPSSCCRPTCLSSIITRRRRPKQLILIDLSSILTWI
jgi:hypothetical protein